MKIFTEELHNNQMYERKFDLVEEQNEVEGEGQEKSQEAQIVEVSREVVLEKRKMMMNKLKATKLVASSLCA